MHTPQSLCHHQQCMSNILQSWRLRCSSESVNAACLGLRWTGSCRCVLRLFHTVTVCVLCMVAQCASTNVCYRPSMAPRLSINSQRLPETHTNNGLPRCTYVLLGAMIENARREAGFKLDWHNDCLSPQRACADEANLSDSTQSLAMYVCHCLVNAACRCMHGLGE